MIINQELVKKVKEHFNLNIYETKVWLALLSKGVVSAGETAELSGVPRSRTYDVLEGLAKRGFAIVKVGKPVKYIAIEPKTVLERMRSNTLQEAQEKVNRLSTLKDTAEYEEIVSLFKTGISPIRIEDLSGHIKGRSNILSKIKELLINAQKEITIHTSIEDFEDKSRVLLPVIRNLGKSDVKLRISLTGDSHKIKRFSNRNDIKIKETNAPGKFYLTDKKEVLFMIHQEKADEEIGVWINSPYFASSFSGIFEKHLRN
jgi:HTH-type transcriptional regulator, sugar sensing transcriptional regulator